MPLKTMSTGEFGRARRGAFAFQRFAERPKGEPTATSAARSAAKRGEKAIIARDELDCIINNRLNTLNEPRLPPEQPESRPESGLGAREQATAPGRTMGAREQATAPGSALGFSREETTIAKLCLSAFEDQENVVEFCEGCHQTEDIDGELCMVVDQCVALLVDALGSCSSVPLYHAYPLLNAASQGFPRVVELFLELGAKVDGVMGVTKQRTALLLTCFYTSGAHLKVAQILLNHGADPTFVAKDAFTALDVARSRGEREEMVELLESHPRVRRALRKRTCAYCEGEGSIVQPPFQVCEGCRRVAYCSRDCQKAAWRSGHRHECAARPTRRFVKKERREPYTMVERAKRWLDSLAM